MARETATLGGHPVVHGLSDRAPPQLGEVEGDQGGRMTRDTNDSWAAVRLTQLQLRDAEDDAGVHRINRQFLDSLKGTLTHAQGTT